MTLLPSATEIVCGMGLFDQLIGVTHECDFPVEVTSLPRVTRSAIPEGLASSDIDAEVREQLETNEALYHLDVELLAELQPDLLVTQALCDVCAVAETEVQRVARQLDSNPEVINLEPMCLTDVLQTIERLGEVTGTLPRARAFKDSLSNRIDTVHETTRQIPHNKRPRVALLEWIDPPFNAGHWNPELIEIAGGIDCLGNANQPSRTVTFDEIQAADPDILVIALCGFDAQRAMQDLDILKANLNWDRLACVKANQVHVLDGNAWFSRPGPRLVDGMEHLAGIIARAQDQVA